MTRPADWSRQARKDLGRLSPQDAERVVRAVEAFADTGRGDLKPITGEPGTYRLRVGDIRILLSPDRATGLLLIIRVLRRDRAYR